MQACTFATGTPLRVNRLAATVPVNRAFTPAVVCKAADTRRSKIAERHRRIRRKLSGTTEKPRLAVFRSNNHIYAQVIDDTKGVTLAAANTLQKAVNEPLQGNGANVEAATAVGKKIAELCLAANVSAVAFDRGGFPYHGRIKAVAEAAREGGLKF